MKILIIEDDQRLAKMLKTAFKKEGITSDYVTDGAEGERRAELHSQDYDLIILDLMLPNRSGDQICKSLREKNVFLPILILTAKNSIDNKVSLLDLGADDYVIKPFSFKELLARVRALHRRPEKTLMPEIKVEDLRVCPATRKVTRAGKALKLTLTEFKLLEYLATHPGQVISRDQLLDSLWDFGFDSFSNVVDVHIKNLRKKVDQRFAKKLLETVHGVGYRIKGNTQ